MTLHEHPCANGCGPVPCHCEPRYDGGQGDVDVYCDACLDPLAEQPHTCPTYVNARGEVIDPADQGGIGCLVCRGAA